MNTSNSSLILPAFNPRDYQSEAATFLVDRPRSLLVGDPGLGKTGTSLLALDMLRLVGSSFFPALVLAPKRVADVVWSGEKDKWSSFQHLNVVQITGTAQERLDTLRRPTADLYVLNYELVPWLVSLFPRE